MKESGFESMEHDNERAPMVSHQSEKTPQSVANEWNGVMEMKNEAMDEAYGMAGKSGAQGEISKAHAQFRNYNWA
jgi:hypothetical protein